MRRDPRRDSAGDGVDAPAHDRRAFLRSLGAAALTLPLARSALAEHTTPGSALAPLGIQLYTVRNAMRADAEGTLAALAKIGYREVELAGLHGKTARETRAILDRHHLSAPATHLSLKEIRDEWPRVLGEAQTLGHRYIVCPWIDQGDRTVDGYKRIASDLNVAGAAAKQAGLQLAYHNHDFEFKPLGGTTGYDLLLAECDQELVKIELDLFWIVKGGKDPLTYFAAYPGRFPLVHVKDMARDGSMVDVGMGTIDFAAIFARAKAAGIRHYFVEHDEPRAPSPTRA